VATDDQLFRFFSFSFLLFFFDSLTSKGKLLMFHSHSKSQTAFRGIVLDEGEVRTPLPQVPSSLSDLRGDLISLFGKAKIKLTLGGDLEEQRLKLGLKGGKEKAGDHKVDKEKERQQALKELIALLAEQWPKIARQRTEGSDIPVTPLTLKIGPSFAKLVSTTPAFLCPSLISLQNPSVKKDQSHTHTDYSVITGENNLRLTQAARDLCWLGSKVVQPSKETQFIVELTRIITGAIANNMTLEQFCKDENCKGKDELQKKIHEALIELLEPKKKQDVKYSFQIWIRRLLELLQNPNIMKPCLLIEGTHQNSTFELLSEIEQEQTATSTTSTAKSTVSFEESREQFTALQQNEASKTDGLIEVVLVRYESEISLQHNPKQLQKASIGKHFIYWMLHVSLVVKIELLRFDFDALLSSDDCCGIFGCTDCRRTKNREGTLAIKTTDRLVTLGWRTGWHSEMTGDAKFWNYGTGSHNQAELESPKEGYLLYYGPSVDLPLDITVIEEDKDSREAIRTIGEVASTIGVIGESAPPPYGLAGTALGLIGAGVTFAANFVDDDLEFKLLTSIPKEKWGLFKYKRSTCPMRVWIRKSFVVVPKSVETKKVSIRIAEIIIPPTWLREIEGDEGCCPCCFGGPLCLWLRYYCHLWICCCCGCGRLRPNIELMATFEKQVLDPFKVKSRNGRACLVNTVGVFDVLVYEAQQNINAPIAFTIALHNGYDPVSDQEMKDAEALLQKAGALQKAVMNEIDRRRQTHLSEVKTHLEKKEKTVNAKVSELSSLTAAVGDPQKIKLENRLKKTQAKLAQSTAAVTSFQPYTSDPNRFKYEEIIPGGLPHIKSLLNEFIPERKSFVNYSGLLHIEPDEVALGKATRYLSFEKLIPGVKGSEQRLTSEPEARITKLTKLEEEQTETTKSPPEIGFIRFEIKIEESNDPATPDKILDEIKKLHQRIDEIIVSAGDN